LLIVVCVEDCIKKSMVFSLYHRSLQHYQIEHENQHHDFQLKTLAELFSLASD
jgi:hypothetical protein